ncbi:MAG: hypothetical protein Q4F75_07470 [Pseudomonadota bacterium]|nr:hypothetical protein [Pseudomonadota bacterium]
MAPAGQILAPEAESFQFAAVSDTGSQIILCRESSSKCGRIRTVLFCIWAIWLPIGRHKMEEVSAAELEKLLRKHKVDMLLFGHVHNYTEGSFAGIPMYTLPSSGQEIRSFVNKFGYVEVAVTPEKVGPAEALYIDNIPGTETGEVWFTDNVLSNKARYISLGLIGAGILILLFLRLKRKK